MLYYIRQIKYNNMIPDYPDFPVYVDSPLAVSATEIFMENEQDCFDEEAMSLVRQGINPIQFRNLRLSITTEESKAINEDDEPKVIISASGMCDAGRIRHHLQFNLDGRNPPLYSSAIRRKDRPAGSCWTGRMRSSCSASRTWSAPKSS